MKHILKVHLFELGDVNIFLKKWSKLEMFNLGQSQTELQFGIEGV